MVQIDSRKVTPGDIFVALKGISSDGHDYIEKAIENGASKIVAEHGNYSVETILTPDTRAYLANYLKEENKEKLSKIKFIGITGTSGKTTTAYLLYQMLNKLGTKTAYLGTIGFYIEEKIRDLDNTTPELTDLYNMFLECQEHNVEVIIMEVSSHSLVQGRVLGLEFFAAAFTNLTQDHLDFHHDFEEYKNAKLKLFSMIEKEGYAIVNNDDSYGKYFLLDTNQNITYGFNNSDYTLTNENLLFKESIFDIRYKDTLTNIHLNIPGRHNLYNYVVVFIISKLLGHSEESIKRETEYISAPPGRIDMITYKDSIIVVDYAHKPDAVEKIIKSFTEQKEGNIITIIGCGGDRDKSKRPIMGEIATKYSDYVIFTNDNPRTEDEKTIMHDITNNLSKHNFEIIHDRKKAIEKGINKLNSKDILLILGKGHEPYQIIGKEHHHFDDKETAINIIKDDLT